MKLFSRGAGYTVIHSGKPRLGAKLPAIRKIQRTPHAQPEKGNKKKVMSG